MGNSLDVQPIQNANLLEIFNPLVVKVSHFELLNPLVLTPKQFPTLGQN